MKIPGFTLAPSGVILAAISGFLCLLSFQNCSNSQFEKSSEVAAPPPNNQNLGGNAIDVPNEGNGVGYDGKIYIIKGTCNSNPLAATDAIKVATDRDRAHLIRKNCSDLNPPTSVEVSHLTFLNDSQLNYQGLTFSTTERVLQSAANIDFTQVGTHSFLKPQLGTSIQIDCWGGGGGGAGGGAGGTLGGGGGGGGYSSRSISLDQLSATEVVTIGAGGLGASGSYANGGTGSPSVFGSHLVASGGVGGLPTCTTGPTPPPLDGRGGQGTSALGENGISGAGGKAGGTSGGAGGAIASSGQSPGGGGGGQWGAGGGGACGNGAGQSGHGAPGKCSIKILP